MGTGHGCLEDIAYRPDAAHDYLAHVVPVLQPVYGVSDNLHGITAFVSQLEPAAPSVDLRTVILGKVQRGLFVREVRGTGVLVPEEDYGELASMASTVAYLEPKLADVENV